MKVLNSVKECEKCGVRLERTLWSFDMDKILGHENLALTRYVGVECRCDSSASGEHIERTCPRCGFVWAEKCAEKP